MALPLLVGLHLVTMLGLGGDTPSPSRLASIREAPPFQLMTQDGQLVRSADLRGKVLLVSFIFTTCNGTCPATTHRMCQVQEELKNRRLLKEDRIRLVSISLDPTRDTPEVLRGYMRLYDVDPKSWTFLTGAKDAVDKVIRDWGMWAKPSANGQLDHPSRIYLVDANGMIREIYNLGFMKPQWVAEDVTILENEAPTNIH